MSKSRGNVIPVDVPLQQYGADTTRLYEMFMGPLETTKPWSMQGVEGISRFLNRAWRMIVDEAADEAVLNPKIVSGSGPTEEQSRVLHKTIKTVTEDLEGLRFNTAISRLMEFVNFFTAQDTRPRACMEAFVLTLAPMAPHICEELWLILGHKESLAYEPWPEYDERFTREQTVEYPIQVNGRLRSRLTTPASATEEDLKQAALADAKVQRYIEGSTVRKIIVVSGKLINIVVS
jgi:leucyl-tRNA synthetase